LLASRESGEKLVLNKNMIVLASSLTVVPLAITLVAIAAHRKRRKSCSQISGFLAQNISRKKSVPSVDATERQQLNRKPQRRHQLMSWQKSKGIMTTTDSTINAIDNSKTTDIHAVIPSTIASNGFDSTIIVPPSITTNTNAQTLKEQEISISDPTVDSRESLKELIITAIKDAKDSAKGRGREYKEQTVGIETKYDSKDTQSLEDNINSMARLFEIAMIEIRKEPYIRQIKLLENYRDLLQTQSKVASARLKMAGKLKPGS
jgi:hypothetical protein